MKKYMLNLLGTDWIFEGETAEEASKEYIKQLGYSSFEAFKDYCESVGVSSEINMKEVE